MRILQTEMSEQENLADEMKNLLEGLPSRAVENRISELEGEAQKTSMQQQNIFFEKPQWQATKLMSKLHDFTTYN